MNISDMFNFLKKRFIRIYPLLFFTTISILFYTNYISVIIKLIYPDLFIKNQPLMFDINTLFLDNILLLNSTPILGSFNGLNGPSWSISAEMISYFIFAFVSIYTIVKKRVVLYALLFVGAVIFVVYYGKFFTAGDFGFVRGFIGFAIGYFVWKLYTLWKRKGKSLLDCLELFVPIAIILELYLLSFFRTNNIQYEMFALISVPTLMGLILLLLLYSKGFLSHMLESKPIQFLGKISYSVYLNHTIFLLLLPKIFFRVFNFEETIGYQIMAVIVILFSVISFSYLTYLFIEKKLSIKLKKWL